MRILLVLVLFSEILTAQTVRPRARELGIKVGVIPTGPLNAITDVADVAVGHATLIRGDDIRTGVTAILPHQRNLFVEKVAGAVFIGNYWECFWKIGRVDSSGGTRRDRDAHLVNIDAERLACGGCLSRLHAGAAG